MSKQKPLFIAGPCSVESEEQIIEIAKKVKKLGIDYLRGGAYKPRTIPDSFQGLGKKGLDFLKKVKEKTGLRIVTELVSPEHIEEVIKVADVVQVGSRNMYNYELLKEIGKRASKKPVLLKRGMSATKKELIGAIGYLKKHGHKAEIIVCERGIRTFSNGEYDRFTLDLSFVADLKKDKKFNYRIIIDPSHAAGRSDIVENLSFAGMAAGADGLMIEVKREGTTALSDDAQAITLKKLKYILKKSEEIYAL